MNSTYIAPTAGDILIERFNLIEKVIPFNPEWANGTGYYDHAIKDSSGQITKDYSQTVSLEPGEEAKCVSDAPNNRRMIFMGTPLGTAVFFERYTDGKDGVVVRNLPSKLEQLKVVSRGSLSADDIQNIFSYGIEDNLGRRLANAFPSK